MLSEQGHHVKIYDVIYAPDESVFINGHYDFITATEVIEHLADPLREITRLWTCLKPGGIMAFMTKFLVPQPNFSNWYYKLDPTHICFYSHVSFNWLATKLGGRLEFPAADIVFLSKKE
jgi:hypothetical protein